MGLEAWWLCSSVVTGTSLGTSPDAWNAELIQLGSIGSNWFHGGSMNFFVAPIFDGFLQRFGVGWARRMHQRLYKSVRHRGGNSKLIGPVWRPWIRAGHSDRHKQVMCHIVTSYWTLGSSMFWFGDKKSRQLTVKSGNPLITKTPSPQIQW